MYLSALPKLNSELGQMREALAAISKKAGKFHLDGLTGTAKSFFLAGLLRESGRSGLVVTYSSEQADRIAEDLCQFGFADDEVFVLPPSDAIIYEEGAPDFRVVGQRLAAMDALLSGKPVVVVAPVNGALRLTMPRNTLEPSKLTIEVGHTLDTDDFARTLVALGYERTEICEVHGEFSLRGGIIDVYPSSEDEPVRIDMFGDEIESIRTFDSNSQRSHGHNKSVKILPAREVILTTERAQAAEPILRAEMADQVAGMREAGQDEEAEKLSDKIESDISRILDLVYFDGIEEYLPYLHPEGSSILDYLPASAIVVVDEPLQIEGHWNELQEEMIEVLVNRAKRGLLLASTRKQHVDLDAAMKRIERNWSALYLTTLDRAIPYAEGAPKAHIESSSMESFSGRFDALVEQVKTWTVNQSRVVIASNQRERLIELLIEHDVSTRSTEELETGAPVGVYVAGSNLRTGFKLPEIGLMVLSDAEVFGVTRTRRPRRVSKEGVPISTILDLKEGDYVVHVSHGIGLFRGIERLETNGVARDYLWLEYSGGDRIFVPTEQIDRVQKYIGSEGNAPSVHKLGGGEWLRTTKRVKASVREMAKDLIELYAWRESITGHAYNEDTPWQQEMESAFPFEETPDQLQAIEEIKGDLEKPKPMDRLLCGDVGYGKTEVAIRAAFKVVSDGKQVAVLAPTTVLAQQHLNTFRERLGAFPIEVDMLSRFKSRKEQKQVIEGVKLGTVDIVVGTHRLLSKDIEFKDLGLIIVDEEQRFGVGHKEKLKQLKKTVDALTMTATPIPRTLHMSLAGIRDMSVINDPPNGRTPIKTFVKEYDDEIVREAIVRELDRGGQIYFIHNRVENIAHIAAHVAKLVPHARVEIGHGQMSDDDLERVMVEFYDRQFDVLVCTTIVESGLDIPNVNTIIINNADKMGLAQLYQLRGRVGRADRQAYAYLMYRRDEALTEIAEKRLEAIREFTDLGSGLKIALRDLEIRGAGNLLGSEQHGQIAQVGFDFYCQMLSQAVSELKGEETKEVELPPVDLPVDAFLPEDYVKTEAQRIFFYKKMAAAKTEREVRQIQEELEDRFGDPLRQVWNMLALIRLRIRCSELNIRSITTEGRQIVIRLAEGYRIHPDVQKEFAKQYKRHWFQADLLRLNPDSPRIITLVEDMVEVAAKALKASEKKHAARGMR